MKLYVRPDGSAQCMYDDAEPIALKELGGIDIKRASNVEPAPLDKGKWIADLAPIGGPTLGPFDTRREALAAEIAWVDAQLSRGPVAVQEQKDAQHD